MKSSDIDALFALPLSEFTPARNALASRLKKGGNVDEAERVKAIAKPPATAWAVNQLFWRHRKDLDRLFSISEKAGKAQAGGRADLRQLLDERRKMISELTTQAAEILIESGQGVSVDARRRIVTTLESLASWGKSNADVQAGRLTSDLEPMGFDGLAALLGDKPIEPASILPFRREAKEKKTTDGTKASRAHANNRRAEEEAAARARAAEAVKTAEKNLTAARRDAERAEAAATKAAARAEAIEEEMREVEARHRKAEQAARGATDEAKKTARALAEAERAVALARKRIAGKP